jgi:hypothetical protein
MKDSTNFLRGHVMLRFSRFLSESDIEFLPSRKKNHADRKNMPQIASDDMADFVGFLKKNGVSVERQDAKPKSLSSTQGHFDIGKIRGIMSSIESGEYKPSPIVISSDNKVIDGHHRWLAHANMDNKPISTIKVGLTSDELLDKMEEYPKSFKKKLYESVELYESACDIITVSQMRQFASVVDKLFSRFGIDFKFTKHFVDRMSDERNSPCISLKELAEILKKLYMKKKHGKETLSQHKDTEIVLKDLQTNLNIPMAIEYDRKNDDIDVVMKTIMRKPNFRTPNPIIRI